MARDLLNRYIWLVDTIRRYGRISRRRIDELWARSPFSNGEPMPRRTFYNYRQAAEELFQVEIKCDPATFEYYIDENIAETDGISKWLLNTAVTHEALSRSSDLASRIFVEDVPSAREFLAPAMDALRHNKPIKFNYLPYSRTITTTGVVLEPYFLKLFKQRWYVTGRHVAENKIKTYALDRMSALRLLPESFEPDENFRPTEFFRNSFGIVFTDGEVKNVVIKVEPRQAKYFRALPLHHTQQEYVHDAYSIFSYRLRLSPDFLEELLSHGSRITVMEPPELRAMVCDELSRSLANYYSDKEA